jgi:hypothetical protein
MIVQTHFAALKQIKLSDMALRFVFGGACTVLAGLIASRWGPVIGGLFLAFPAIFPAGASLLEKHEIEKKRQIGPSGSNRGRVAAGVDAAGAAIGSAGLATFAAVVWKALPGHNPYFVIASATLCWSLVSVSLWLLRKSRLFRTSTD